MPQNYSKRRLALPPLYIGKRVGFLSYKGKLQAKILVFHHILENVLSGKNVK